MTCLTRGSSKLLRPWEGFGEGEDDLEGGGAEKDLGWSGGGQGGLVRWGPEPRD